MPETLRISPLTRVEGHLDIELTVERPGSFYQVTEAKANGTNFRGFEIILKGRDPRDATQYTQRVCGVCPISHGLAAALALEDAQNFNAPSNGRILRNLVLGANFVASHVLHFYHLTAPDYIDTTGILEMSPWKPRFVTPDMITGDLAKTLVQHYVQALAIRRKAHQMGAIFGGKLPNGVNFVSGGSTEAVTTTKVSQFRALLDEIRKFIDQVYVPDATALTKAFPEYFNIGRGHGNLIAYGVFDLENTSNDDDDRSSSGGRKLLRRGRYTQGQLGSLDVRQIKEYVSKSWYTAASGNRNPAQGRTEVAVAKAGAYSWIKAPRYLDRVHEAGPLARMWINGDYRRGISSNDRNAARALETKKVADAMNTWLGQLRTGSSSYTYKALPTTGSGIGLTEAPRGALGHWVNIASKKIANYQIITPTAWNASPKDDRNQRGPMEQSLVGLRIADLTKPVEVLRVVHSFDPCLSCSVHMVEPETAARHVIQL